MNEQELKDRAKRFAHRCVKLAVCLPEERTVGDFVAGSK
jgi:hypothetical protein